MTSKTEKRTYRIKVLIKNCPQVFKEGYDPGEIGSQEMIFDLTKKQYDSIRLTDQIYRQSQELIDELIEVKVDIVENDDDTE